jgi:hypothetical protein
MYYWGGGCVLITQPQAIQQPHGVCGGGEGGGEGKVVEQQTGALGNPRSSFSSSSSSLCIRQGFDKIFTLGSAVQPLLDCITIGNEKKTRVLLQYLGYHLPREDSQVQFIKKFKLRYTMGNLASVSFLNLYAVSVIFR